MTKKPKKCSLCGSEDLKVAEIDERKKKALQKVTGEKFEYKIKCNNCGISELITKE
ncbi:MAG: hypothetical protein R6U26_00550 [Candidatus Undinarchaeales archaeon]